MNGMTPDLARLLVTQRLDDVDQHRRRRAARAAASSKKVPQQRRAAGFLARIVPGNGVRAEAR